ncbi:hypothetical protein B0T26DRAFT_390519 [Lasiosphaeria miniovina]|uniref:CENP-V/GFA domain-containing protein n=1 Tax=Lasiosphaeria miniovina TaxID=1954250 RepID=A0AA40A497_9PEZI|nr:uncharacterized protein B0T26DRAFT_390519 [Lasiosphaeria miniovina]KAK0709016.1 hypothetical protein B0T26DRAFT_390519 [Lasiosphaeria miniovina]
MSYQRPLRGSCHCGRNRYIIQFPKDTVQSAEVLFNSVPSHRVLQASPLAAFLRVPLQWYHSTTLAFYPDETSSMIHRVYTSPHEQHAMRHFCGFCGTPLSYWSEEPRSEADFIQLTLGSLLPEDLADLGEFGFLSEPDDDDDAQAAAGKMIISPRIMSPRDTDMGMQDDVVGFTSAGRQVVGALPWFDKLTAGSRLGTLRAHKGYGGNQNGTVRVEWEIVEWTPDDDATSSGRNSKRKLDDVSAMEDVQQ